MWCDEEFLKQALKEDLGTGDITCLAVIPEKRKASAKLICKEEGVLSGSSYFTRIFQLVDSSLQVQWFARDGEPLTLKQEVAHIEGHARSILAAERTALNLLQHLSGIATQTREISRILEGSSVILLDTRKTMPLWRKAQKEAVKHGGGENHRMGLYDRFLIKENHIAAAGSLTQAVKACKDYHPGLEVEVETTCLAEVEEALNTEADIIMLDNFPNSEILKAAHLIREQSSKKIEVSGNMSRERILQLKNYPVDYISMGALTHSVRALDFSLLVDWADV